jgi:hypothetical protein
LAYVCFRRARRLSAECPRICSAGVLSDTSKYSSRHPHLTIVEASHERTECHLLRLQIPVYCAPIDGSVL